jgi:hypothetical protein
MYNTLNIADGSAPSSTHSIRRSNDGLVRHGVAKLPPGTSPYKALTVSSSVATEWRPHQRRSMHHCLRDLSRSRRGRCDLKT